MILTVEAAGWSTYNDIITVTNNVPVIESYAISADEVNRTDILSMTIEVSDTENADNLLSIQVQYKSPAGNWSSTSLSTAWYDSSAEKWKLNFTASDTAELGDYDVRVKVTDSDDTASSWSTYNDNFEVKMAPEWSYSTGSDVLAVAFSSDGEYMVTGSKDNKVYLFSKDSSTPLWSYTTGNDVYSVAISGNGEYIAAGSDDNKIYFFDKDSSTPEWSSNLGDDVRAVAVSEDGETIVAGAYNAKVFLFGKDSGDSVWSYDTGNLNIETIDISADGNYIVTGGEDSDVRLFSKDSSTPQWSYSTGGMVTDISISSDGEYIIAGSKDNKAYLFDKDSSTPVWSYTASGDFLSVDISADGEYIVASSDTPNQRVYLFDKDSNTPIWDYTVDCLAVSISADGEYIAAGCDDNVYFWDKDSSSTLWSYNVGSGSSAFVKTVDISADAKYFAAGSKNDKVYTFRNGFAERPSAIPYGPRSGTEQLTPILSWFAGSDDRSNLTFDIYLDTNSNPTTKVANDISALTYTPTNLAINTKYYWKVVATDPSGSATSKVMNFTYMGTAWSYQYTDGKF